MTAMHTNHGHPPWMCRLERGGTWLQVAPCGQAAACCSLHAAAASLRMEWLRLLHSR